MYLPKKVSGAFQSFKKKFVLAAQQVSEEVLSRLVEWQKQLLLTSTRNLYQHRSMSKMIRKQQWTKDKRCGPASALPCQCLRVGGDIEALSSDLCLIPGVRQRIQLEMTHDVLCKLRRGVTVFAAETHGSALQGLLPFGGCQSV